MYKVIETESEHREMVAVLKKPGNDILQELNADDCDLLHMALGACGETGELLDQVKKFTIYRKPLDLDNIVEELGDLEFYIEGIRQRLNITRDQTLRANINKLAKRYPEFKYSNVSAIARADKQ